MPAPARAKTAHWAPKGPKTRPFRHGVRTDADADTEQPLQRGTVIAERYRIEGMIGQGGMGRVYAATHVQEGHRVALKLLRTKRSEREQAARLRQEAKAASRIGHRAIVSVLDFDTTPDGLSYLAMELLTGESFEDWLERPGRMLDGVRWLAEAARGLDAAHKAGIVHRDVKPDNVFLHHLPDGTVQPKLLDFGLAKATATDLTQVETQAGTLLGTPYYLAPERALGRPLDPRADLYSLGVMLYETLTGNVPFVDDSFMGILARHIKSQPLDPRQAAPDRALPEDLCLLVMALLAKDPGDRPASGGAVAALLDRVIDSQADALAKILSGPRDVAGPGDETTNLDVIAQRPTAAPDPSASGSGHRPAIDTSAATVAPDLPLPPTSATPADSMTWRKPTQLAGSDGAVATSTGTVLATPGTPVTTSTGTVLATPGVARALLPSAGSPGDPAELSGEGGVGVSSERSVEASEASLEELALPVLAPAPRSNRVWVIAGGGLAAAVIGGAIAFAFVGPSEESSDPPTEAVEADPGPAPVGKPAPTDEEPAPPPTSPTPEKGAEAEPGAKAEPPADADADVDAGAGEPGPDDAKTAGATEPPRSTPTAKKRKAPRRNKGNDDDGGQKAGKLPLPLKDI